MFLNKCALICVVCLVGCGRTGSQQNAASSDGKDQIEIVGEYEFKSWNPVENQTYKGSTTITRKGDYYQISFENGKGAGVGIRKGNTLSVAYLYSERADDWGGGTYAIEKGNKSPRLVGDYTPYPGNGKFGKDTWTFVRTLE